MFASLIEGVKYYIFHSKIKDKEACPCGSGKLFQECCKDKPAKHSIAKEPPEVQLMKMMRSSMPRLCMHPDKRSCNGKIKKAHALQNNKIISLLAGADRHVFMLDAKKQPVLIPLDNGETIPFVEISKVSANDATTETCFCDYHDNIAFAAIEKGAPDFDINSKEMKFVYAYKAFVFEAYKEETTYSIFQKCFKQNPEAYQSKEMVLFYRMLQLKHQEFEPVQKHYGQQIMASAYEGIYTCAVEIAEQIQFADYAFFAPDFDMNGKTIRHTKNGVLHRISLTIFPEEHRSWLLVSCLDTELSIYKDLFDQLSYATVNKLKFYLNLMLPLYSENMVLGFGLWTTWDEMTQMSYTYYANLDAPDAKKISFAVQMWLRNAAKKKDDSVYDNQPKINLFP